MQLERGNEEWPPTRGSDGAPAEHPLATSAGSYTHYPNTVHLSANAYFIHTHTETEDTHVHMNAASPL